MGACFGKASGPESTPVLGPTAGTPAASDADRERRRQAAEARAQQAQQRGVQNGGGALAKKLADEQKAKPGTAPPPPPTDGGLRSALPTSTLNPGMDPRNVRYGGPAPTPPLALVKMRLDNYVQQTARAVRASNWELLGLLLRCFPDQDGYGQPEFTHLNRSVVTAAVAAANVGEPFDDLVLAHVLIMQHIGANELDEAYTRQASLVVDYLRTFTTQDRYALPVLHALNRDARLLAAKADQRTVAAGGKPTKLNDVARVLNRSFNACVTDRAALLSSKKWGSYHIANNLFKVYFRVRQLRLCYNVIRSLEVSKGPDLSRMSAAQRTTFNYYVGLLAFEEEDYDKARTLLLQALRSCTASSRRNRQLILLRLVPLQLLLGIVPRESALRQHGLVQLIDFVRALRTGDVSLYRATLAKHEQFLLQKRLYIPIERVLLLVYRRRLKLIHVALGAPARLALAAIRLGLELVGEATSVDELECTLVRLIDKNLVKGYVAHEKLTLVLSNKDPFPPYSQMQW